MSTEVFKAKSRAEIAELVEWSRASIAGESREISQENQSASQVGVRKASATRKMSFKLNYVLDLSDYTGTSTVLNMNA